MSKLSTVFLCGDQSPYGVAHLEAVIKEFDVKAIILADEERWKVFRRSLSGGDEYVSTHQRKTIRHKANQLIKKIRSFTKKKDNPFSAINTPVIRLHDVNNNESIKLIENYSPDILISAAYPQIFSKTLVNLTPKGAVNFHPSLLPKCRGAHPHYWCIATGEKKGGVSAHFMTENIDDGDLLAQIEFNIEEMYYNDLYKKIIEETPRLVKSVAEFFKNPLLKATPQNNKYITTFRNDRVIHRKLDFTNTTSIDLWNKIRAGRAYFFYKDEQFYVTKADVSSQNRHMTNNLSITPGTIIDINHDGVIIYTCDDAFIILKNLRWTRKQQYFSKWVDKFSVSIGERVI